jgi:glyoxylate reductase
VQSVPTPGRSVGRRAGIIRRTLARCFVTHDLPGPALGRLRAVHDVDLWTEPLPPTPGQLAERAADAEGLLSMLVDRIDGALLERCPKLRAIANYAVGYDNIDLAATRARGILVGNTPDVLTDATADLTFALILAIARRLGDAAASVKDGEWGTWEPDNYLGYDVHGATLGIIGLGRIGHAVARRAAGFDMTVIHAGRDPAGLDDLFARADFVSVHCPLTSETRHLIDADALFKMRPTAMLINTARGPIVDQDALREALVDGAIAGAALDVTDPEPLAPDDPLMSAPNLIVVPHIGSATHQAREGMATLAVENLLAALDGRPMPHEVH